MNKITRSKIALLTIFMIPLFSWAQEGSISSAEVIPEALMTSGEPPIVSPTVPRHAVEMYTSRQQVSSGYADWSETGLRGNYEVGANLFRAELASMRRFGESGKYFGIGDTVTISPDWFTTISFGAGDGVSYLPRYRVDGFINRKFLAEKNLVGTLGAGYYRAPDGHSDRNFSIGGTYYFTQPFVLQAEIKFNTSNPGSVRTQQQFIAATWGHEKKTQIAARYAWGVEGYQSIGAGASQVGFRSHQASIAVRHWVSDNWGVSASTERYKNPSYQRNGINVGLFLQFQ